MKKVFLIATICSLTWTVYAQNETVDIDEIARRMSNPTLPLMNVTSFFEYQAFTGDLPGADDQSLFMFALQPPLPFPLKNGESLIFRPLIPLLFNQPVFGENGFESAGLNLGNIGFDLLYGGTNKSGFLRGVGMVGNIPSATNADIRNEWAIGPEVVAGIMRPWGVFLILLTQSWDISGDVKSSRLGGQYAIAFSLPGGWQLVSSPPFSYNWDTKKLTLPLGGGPFRTVILGSTPVKLGIQALYYVSQVALFPGIIKLKRFYIKPLY
jgi:hypothetical protein